MQLDQAPQQQLYSFMQLDQAPQQQLYSFMQLDQALTTTAV